MRHSDHGNNSGQSSGDRLPYVGPHKHVCCFYRTHSEMERLWLPFILEGLKQQQKCVVVVGTDYSVEQALDALNSAGLDAAAHLQNGSLAVVDNDGFPTSPAVKAEEIIDFWKQRLAMAFNEGYASVRAVVQMTWLADTQRDCDFVPEYEFLCNQVYSELSFSALCMYDTAIFSKYQLERVTAAHPYVASNDSKADANVVSTRQFILRRAVQAGEETHTSDAAASDLATELLAARSYVESERLYRAAVESETGLAKVTAMLGLIESLRGQGRSAEAEKIQDAATELLLRRY